MDIGSAVLSRDGLLGRQLIGGSEPTRKRYDRLRRVGLRSVIADREAAASKVIAGSNAIPDADGFRVLADAPDALGDVIDATRASIAAVTDSQSTSGKTQLLAGFTDQAQIALDSPFMRFALDEQRLLAPISDYLGVVPFLTKIDTWKSVPKVGPLSDSQIYHCDWDAARMLRVFVYATDVTADDGPLVVLPASTSEAIRKRTRYTYLPRVQDKVTRRQSCQRLTDEQIAAAVPGAAPVELTGPAGTVALVDTCRCFHYGSRLAQMAPPRLVAIFQFQPPTSFTIRRRSEQDTPFARLAGAPGLSPLQRMVLGG